MTTLILFDVGSQGRAATFITKFMDSLRGEDGVWRSLHVVSPSSGPVQVYFNRDQSPQKGAIETFGKKLRNIIKDSFPGKDVRLIREEGKVAIDWMPLVMVVAPRRNQIELKWYPPDMDMLGLSQDSKRDITRRFAAARGHVPDDQWCS